jgi:hypothetical protein
MQNTKRVKKGSTAGKSVQYIPERRVVRCTKERYCRQGQSQFRSRVEMTDKTGVTTVKALMIIQNECEYPGTDDTEKEYSERMASEIQILTNER